MRQLKISTKITNRDSVSLERYLNEISKLEMISPEQEVELARQIKMGSTEALENLFLMPFGGFVNLLCKL